MWLNYFLTTFRSLRRNSFYVMANLLSLGVAFALMIIGYFNYDFNQNFNHFFPNAKNIYKVNSTRLDFSDDVGMGISPLPLMPSATAALGNSKTTRYTTSSVIVRKGEELLSQHAAYVDPDFLEIFHFPATLGGKINVDHKSQVIITSDLAETLFGSIHLTGEELVLQKESSKKVYEIVGVLKDTPENISFRFDLIFLFDDFLDQPNLDEHDWSIWVDASFVELPENGLSIEEVQAILNKDLEIQNEYNKGRKVATYRLDNLLDWPVFENQLYQSSFVSVLHPASVLGTISSAVFVMLLACFNFINISISLSGQRLKEIAMRKVLGSTRKRIVQQFLFENLVLVFISVGISIGLAYWLIPAYNSLFDYNIVQFEFLEWKPFVIFSVVLFGLVILLAGGYPAWSVSRFPSLQIFRDRVRLGGRGKLLGLLIGIQFIICFYNVFSLLVFVENAGYQETLDRGYQVEDVLNLPVHDYRQLALLEKEISQLSSVSNFGSTKQLIGFHSDAQLIRYEGKDHEIEVLAVGENYLETVEVRLMKGRSFRNRIQDQDHVIINALMEERLGGTALGRNMQLGDQSVKVIGVVEDFNLKTILLDNEIKPALIKLAKDDELRYLSLVSSSKPGTLLDVEIEQLWYALFPDELYRGFLQERVFRPLKQTNHIVISINSFVAVVALIISVLGLYSTVSLSISRRIKELGIRKVLGATAWQIAFILNYRLMIILGVASVLGLTGAYLFISNLLDVIYAYHISIDVRHFVFPIILILLIVLGSVGWKIGKSVTENPVKQLRAE